MMIPPLHPLWTSPTPERPDQHNAFTATAVEGRMDCHVAEFTAIIHDRS
jgi:hypothetical protein